MVVTTLDVHCQRSLIRGANSTHVVDVGDTECEAGGNADTKSQLALLPILADRDTRAGLSEELAEGHGDGSLFRVEDVVGRSRRTSGTDNTNASAAEEATCQYASNADDVKSATHMLNPGGPAAGTSMLRAGAARAAEARAKTVATVESIAIEVIREAEEAECIGRRDRCFPTDHTPSYLYVSEQPRPGTRTERRAQPSPLTRTPRGRRANKTWTRKPVRRRDLDAARIITIPIMSTDKKGSHVSYSVPRQKLARIGEIFSRRAQSCNSKLALGRRIECRAVKNPGMATIVKEIAAPAGSLDSCSCWEMGRRSKCEPGQALPEKAASQAIVSDPVLFVRNQG